MAQVVWIDGAWYLRYDLPPDPQSGNRRQRKRKASGRTRAEAEKELARLVTEIERGATHTSVAISVSDYSESWLESIRHEVGERTHQRYAQLVQNQILPHLGAVQIKALTPTRIKSFYNRLQQPGGRLRGAGGLSPRTILHVHRLLHQILGRAVEDGYLLRNPTESPAARPPRIPPAQRVVLSEEQTAELLDLTQDTALYTPILIASSMGMRLGEILGLQWRSVDLERGLITIQASAYSLRARRGAEVRIKAPKSGRTRQAIMPASLVEHLRDIRRPGQKFVVEEDGAPISQFRVSRQFANLITKIHKADPAFPRVRFHDLRHSLATQLIRRGVPLTILSQRLGHANVATTLGVYGHVLPGMDDAAALQIEEILTRNNQ